MCVTEFSVRAIFVANIWIHVTSSALLSCGGFCKHIDACLAPALLSCDVFCKPMEFFLSFALSGAMFFANPCRLVFRLLSLSCDGFCKPRKDFLSSALSRATFFGNLRASYDMKAFFSSSALSLSLSLPFGRCKN